jgi:hypothetical protein
MIQDLPKQTWYITHDLAALRPAVSSTSLLSSLLDLQQVSGFHDFWSFTLTDLAAIFILLEAIRAGHATSYWRASRFGWFTLTDLAAIFNLLEAIRAGHATSHWRASRFGWFTLTDLAAIFILHITIRAGHATSYWRASRFGWFTLTDLAAIFILHITFRTGHATSYWRASRFGWFTLTDLAAIFIPLEAIRAGHVTSYWRASKFLCFTLTDLTSIFILCKTSRTGHFATCWGTGRSRDITSLTFGHACFFRLKTVLVASTTSIYKQFTFSTPRVKVPHSHTGTTRARLRFKHTGIFTSCNALVLGVESVFVTPATSIDEGFTLTRGRVEEPPLFRSSARTRIRFQTASILMMPDSTRFVVVWSYTTSLYKNNK